jgi:hypothetical protein
VTRGGFYIRPRVALVTGEWPQSLREHCRTGARSSGLQPETRASGRQQPSWWSLTAEISASFAARGKRLIRVSSRRAAVPSGIGIASASSTGSRLAVQRLATPAWWRASLRSKSTVQPVYSEASRDSAADTPRPQEPGYTFTALATVPARPG